MRIVSLTPIALARDSRTLKSAAAYGRWGFKSIVIEGMASTRSFAALPIAVHAVSPARPNILRRAGRGALRKSRGRLGSLAVFVGFLAHYFYTYCLLPLRVMRRGAVYHLHSYEYFPLVRLWCVLLRGRYIYDAHDMYAGIQTEAEMSSVQRRWIRPFQLWIERKCVAGAAAFLTVNAGTAGLLERQFGRRPLVVRNCHDFRLNRARDRTVRDAAGVKPQDFLVVSVGNWKSGQATEEAIAALTLLPKHVHLAFVGAGYDHIDATAKDGEVKGRVHLLGPVAADEVVPFITTADAGLMHYYYHNANYANALPNGFFQVLAASIPLVYGDLPGLVAEAQWLNVGIKVDVRSPHAIADAIRNLIDDVEARQRERDAARRFSLAINFEQEEKILRTILDDIVVATTGPKSCTE